MRNVGLEIHVVIAVLPWQCMGHRDDFSHDQRVALPTLKPEDPDFFNAFALSLTDPVTGVPGGAPIRPRCASALDLRQVRPNALAAQEIDERFVVVTLIAAETGWTEFRLRPRLYPFALLSIKAQQCGLRRSHGDPPERL